MKLIISHSKEIISTVVAGVIIAIISALILDFIYSQKGPDETIVYTESNSKDQQTPQLWSHHKLLNIGADECADKAISTLRPLKFMSEVKNKHYAYGNLDGNRAVVKCVDLADRSFVYVAVAGADVKSVEKLRNDISWQL